MHQHKSFEERRPATTEWVRANGLDPAAIGEDVQVVASRFIRYQPVVTADDGTKSLGDPRLIPMKVAPNR
ncbi:hypothetical protein [Streptomyces lavendulocolor]|uniref:hypothetical protein n=1 Tax=Streptomyces lavendulocolor TaxID=67316 RepID=UPI0031E0F112